MQSTAQEPLEYLRDIPDSFASEDRQEGQELAVEFLVFPLVLFWGTEHRYGTVALECKNWTTLASQGKR